MRRICKRVSASSGRRAIRLAIRNHMRLMAIAVVMSLLVASLPVTAGTKGVLNQQSRSTSPAISLPAQFYHSLSETVASVSSWAMSFISSKPSSTYQPVAAYISPAPPFIDAPTSLTVTAVASNSISLSWTAPAGTVDHYVLERSANINGPFLLVANVTGATTKNDTTVTNLHAYLYRVRAVSSTGAISTPGNMALGTAISFQFSSLQNQTIQAQHFSDVRTAINLVRAAGNVPAQVWTRSNLTNLTIQAADVNEMRTALDAGLSALYITPTAYTDPTLSVGANGTLIKAIHLEQLQTRSTRGMSSSSGPLDSDSSTARLDPLNETGGGGENPLSRNFNWNLPLVRLPGRANMDLSLSLSYNSLVWTRINASYISFDDDRGFPSPGFRLGFPVIQPLHFNAEVGKSAFLLISSDGKRTELRQVGAPPSTLFESADSSHILFDTSDLTLLSTDGTEFTYSAQGGEYKCIKVKDRNGNYITVTYTQDGQINNLTDTLGRVITFEYTNGLLMKIKQVWNQGSPSQVTHYWARFEYANTTIDTNFGTMTVFGPADTSTITTLSKVTLADDSHFDFSYTSWGQVWKVSRYAADNHLLNYRSYNLPQTGTGAGSEHSDCPRFTQVRDWAQFWNGDTDGTPATNEEALTQFEIPVGDTWTMPVGYQDTAPQTGTRAQVTLPDGTSNKIYFIGTAGTDSGWRRGLAALMITYDSLGAPQRQVMTSWTQDDDTEKYILNPRAFETNIYDPAGNRKRSDIQYQAYPLPDGMSCQLPQDVREYDSDASTILRTRRNIYIDDSPYLSRRIIGLPKHSLLYEGVVNPSNLKAKLEFIYDESGSIVGADEPVQHDDILFDEGFVTGRGNVSSVKRYDITDASLVTATTIRTKYNTAGAVVSSKDASNHETQFSYTDSFSDGINRNTLAYATTLTDANGFTTTSKYHFDFGAPTLKRTPQPNETTNVAGPQTFYTYDAIGRLQQVSNSVNAAYTRFEYPGTQIRFDTYSTKQEGTGESYSFQMTDGAGRVIATATDHPGSTGGYSGQRTVYDVMGRVIETSNPTETSATGTPFQWNTAGDDSSAGWIYTQQTYDWKGRPLVTTNQDGTTKTASYIGCGCAGGEVVTTTDEGTIDAGGVTKKAQQKVYSDILGRTVKTELLNWEGGTVYSATVNSYNARDQLTQMAQYVGPAGSATHQDTLITYDGYGRVKTKHTPEQDQNTFTTWTYNADDSVNVITDPRGATSTFAYNNNRHLVTTATYQKSGSPTITLNYSYDAVGNTLSMSDPSGSTSYTYNALSQVTSEVRQFNGLSGQSFTFNYLYNFSGLVKSVTLPTQFGTSVSYQYDRMSRLSGVTGTGYHYSDPNIIQTAVEVPLPTFLTNISYRAWNDMKGMDEGQGVHVQFNYNSRMQPSSYAISNLSGSSSMSWNYDYHPNGRVRLASDIQNNHLDRKYEYDQVGRLVEAYTGNEARGGSANNPIDSPYRQTNSYDAFGNLLQQTGRIWQLPLSGESFSYTNNRRAGLTYDAAGNVITDVQGSHTFNALGQRSLVTTGSVGGGDTGNPQMPASEQGTVYDAAGNPAIISNTNRGEELVGQGPQTTISTSSASSFYLRSSVLDAVIAVLDEQGHRNTEYIYAAGERIAAWDMNPWNDSIEWQHKNFATGSWVSVWAGLNSPTRTEVDPRGFTLPLEPFFIPEDPPERPQVRETFYEIEGGPSIESQLAMQLYEDRYINQVFGPGAGPGQGNYTGQAWQNWQTEREFQLMTGQQFLFGIDRMNANVPGNSSYEWVDNYVDRDGGETWSQNPDDGSWHASTTVISVNQGYFRLIPGGQSSQSQKPLHNPLTPAQRDVVDLAGHLAGNILATRPECGKYLTDGKKVDVLKVFGQVQRAMTFDPNLDPAFPGETDTDAPGKIKPVRLGRSFFDLRMMDVGLLQQFELLNIDAFEVLAKSYEQQAFVMLHEFKHAVTGKEHKTVDEYKQWMEGVYENCFKPKK